MPSDHISNEDYHRWLKQDAIRERLDGLERHYQYRVRRRRRILMIMSILILGAITLVLTVAAMVLVGTPQ